MKAPVAKKLLLIARDLFLGFGLVWLGILLVWLLLWLSWKLIQRVRGQEQTVEQPPSGPTAFSLGAITVSTLTNLLRVDFKPVSCPHPGCKEAHSYQVVERYGLVRVTEADEEQAGTVVGKRLLHSITNDWRSVTSEVAHPSVYRMHTRPGEVYLGNRTSSREPELPPTPPVARLARPAAALQPRRSASTNLPGDAQAQAQASAQVQPSTAPDFDAAIASAVLAHASSSPWIKDRYGWHRDVTKDWTWQFPPHLRLVSVIERTTNNPASMDGSSRIMTLIKVEPLTNMPVRIQATLPDAPPPMDRGRVITPATASSLVP